MNLNLRDIADQLRDEHDAYLLLEELRWHGRPVCAHCGHDKVYFLAPRGGTRGTGRPKPNGRRTQSVRRVWKCAKCRKQFSVLTNTIFHGTKVSLRTWLMVMVQMCSATSGISAREVERMHGVTPETAWYMLHRLSEAMKREPLAGMITGAIRPTRPLSAASQEAGTAKASAAVLAARPHPQDRMPDRETAALSLSKPRRGKCAPV